jgi:hypothetical protein
VRRRSFLAGDLNGHIDERAEGYEEVRGGYWYGVRNGEGERILEFTLQQKLAVCNSYFKKEVENLTYNSGGNKSMLDYILVRGRDGKYVINWNSIGGLECVKQHKLVICDMRLKEQKRLKKKYEPRIKV